MSGPTVNGYRLVGGSHRPPSPEQLARREEYRWRTLERWAPRLAAVRGPEGSCAPEAPKKKKERFPVMSEFPSGGCVEGEDARWVLTVCESCMAIEGDCNCEAECVKVEVVPRVPACGGSGEAREEELRAALKALYDLLPRFSCKSARPDGCPVCVARALLRGGDPGAPADFEPLDLGDERRFELVWQQHSDWGMWTVLRPFGPEGMPGERVTVVEAARVQGGREQELEEENARLRSALSSIQAHAQMDDNSASMVWTARVALSGSLEFVPAHLREVVAARFPSLSGVPEDASARSTKGESDG